MSADDDAILAAIAAYGGAIRTDDPFAGDAGVRLVLAPECSGSTRSGNRFEAVGTVEIVDGTTVVADRLAEIRGRMEDGRAEIETVRTV